MTISAPPRPQPAPAGGEPVLTLDSVSVELRDRRILDNVSLTLRAGELTALIGTNGAGKTTLMRVILGLQRQSGGQMSVLAPGGRRGNDARRGIGYVPQKFMLDRDLPMRARDLVALGIDGHRLGIARPSAQRRERVERMLDAVGTLHLADARVGRLSGGEQQRVLIAHALIGQPGLLLLDEPLANLDLRSAREVANLLARIAREQNVAVLISAHEMNALLPVTDRVIYLAEGRAACGTPAEVVRADVLSRLYGHPVDVLEVNGRVVVLVGDTDTTQL